MSTIVASGSYEALKAATCLIEAPRSKGTGYLVSGNRIVTCHHVVSNAAVGEIVTVTFTDREPTTARVTDKIDIDADAAVLEWQEPFADIAPLRFGRATVRKSVWEGYGYPKLAAGQGLPIDGTIDDLNGRDTRGKAAIILTAGKFEAGTGAPAYGFSGSPVTFNGCVIGHLKRIVEDPDERGHVAYGTVYAARAEDFLEGLLPGETFDPVVPIASVVAIEPAPEGEYDVTLSASARDIPKAVKLVHALEQQGKRVFFPIRDIRPEERFADAMTTALSKSRAALFVIGPGGTTPQDAEGSILWSWHERASYPVVPVLIDKAPDDLPAPWSDLRPVDLRDRDYSGATLQRLICTIEGRPINYEVVAADQAGALTMTANPQANIANARRLIAIGSPRKALEILPESSQDPEVRGIRALALAKSNRTRESIRILEGIQTEGRLSAEMGGILGGRYRQMWELNGDRTYLKRALKAYQSVFATTGDPYPGINTASLLLQLGDPTEAAKVASAVLAKASQMPAEKMDHWTRATLGEARLIVGDFPGARDGYEDAVLQAPELFQDLAVMRRGARRGLKALGRNEHEFDDIFLVPRPIAFVGHGLDLPGQPPRFPQSLVGEARAAIRKTLARLDARLGVASATVGGDTLFIDEMLAREASPCVLLPCAQGDFLNYFVPQPDRQYEVRRLFQRAEVVVVDDPSDPADLWADFAPRLRDYAQNWGRQLDETPILIALWDGQPSFLQSVIERWKEQNFEVETLRIRDGRITTENQ